MDALCFWNYIQLLSGGVRDLAGLSGKMSGATDSAITATDLRYSESAFGVSKRSEAAKPGFV